MPPVSELPPPEQVAAMPPKGMRKYPWHQWLKVGPPIKLLRGTHYRCLDSTMAANAREMGRRLKLSVETSCNSEFGCVYVRTLGPLPEDEPAS